MGRNRKLAAVAGGVVVAVVVVAGGVWLAGRGDSTSPSASSGTRPPDRPRPGRSRQRLHHDGTGHERARPAHSCSTPTRTTATSTPTAILPVGDGKYVTDAPEAGLRVRVPRRRRRWRRVHRAARGSSTTTPSTTSTRRSRSSGTVKWDGTFSMTVNGTSARRSRPTTCRTTTRPACSRSQPSDPAYQYDRNPNHIAAQSLTYTLAASPTIARDARLHRRRGRRHDHRRRAVRRVRRRRARRRRVGGAGRLRRSPAECRSEYHYHTLSSVHHRHES